MTEATLHGFFRSSATYRVKIALALKPASCNVVRLEPWWPRDSHDGF